MCHYVFFFWQLQGSLAIGDLPVNTAVRGCTHTRRGVTPWNDGIWGMRSVFFSVLIANPEKRPRLEDRHSCERSHISSHRISVSTAVELQTSKICHRLISRACVCVKTGGYQTFVFKFEISKQNVTHVDKLRRNVTCFVIVKWRHCLFLDHRSIHHFMEHIFYHFQFRI